MANAQHLSRQAVVNHDINLRTRILAEHSRGIRTQSNLRSCAVGHHDGIQLGSDEKMLSRNLTAYELPKANALLNDIRARLTDLAAGDAALLFAYRRKIARELSYDERGKPMHRRALKAWKIGEQGGMCAICSKELAETNAVLDRLNAVEGYTPTNTRVIHADCELRIQAERGYR
jgi:UTP:GlnB (protein PII) uridylyltransferase